MRTRPAALHPTTRTFRTWASLRDFYRRNAALWRTWVFRGENEVRDTLKSRLERSAARFDVPLERLPGIESDLLREFRRHYHRYSGDVPAAGAVMEWMALMQHHGGPTRLLDWTYSFYVALYFAVEKLAFERDAGSACAVWALDIDAWRGRAFAVEPRLRSLTARDPNAKKPKTVRAILALRRPFVYPLNPERLSDRLAFQQGVFLVPGDVTRPYAANMAALQPGGKGDATLYRLELLCDRTFLKEALDELRRMNVNRATLFPGLDGFAGQLESMVPAFDDARRRRPAGQTLRRPAPPAPSARRRRRPAPRRAATAPTRPS